MEQSPNPQPPIKRTSWIFNPPGASHFGGVWERQIRTIRKVLLAVCKEQRMTEEALYTLMCEVEFTVNSRPLTKSSDDPNDFEALTPNHLLLMKSDAMLPPGLFEKTDILYIPENAGVRCKIWPTYFGHDGPYPATI